jgi:PleD family two-component response regulator
MKVLVMDERRQRAGEIGELLRKKKHDVVECVCSNDFMTAIQESVPQAIALDLDSWNRGRAVYEYFGQARRLADVPIVFYNAPEDFSTLPDRARLERDAVLPKQSPVETIVETVSRLG